MDRRLLNKHIASMLAVILVLTNSNVTLPAEEVSSETESIFVETNQETVLDTSQQIQIEETQENIGEEAPAEEQPAEAPEATAANQTVESPEASAEEQPTTGKENAGEEQSEKQTETSTSEKEQSEEQTETLTGETLEETSEEASEEGSESLDLRSEDENERTISTVQELVDLSKKEPQEYQNAKIILAPHDTNEWDLSGTEFAGLGSDAYPFKGSISFSGNYTGYITLDKSLFNAVSSDAKIISTLNLKAANNMPDPIFAKSYVKEKQTDPATISLKIDVKSTDITEGGGQTSYSSFGGIIGTLGEDASVSLNITSIIPQAKAAVSGEGNRGFFCNAMMKNASLTVSAFSGYADFQVSSTDGNAGALVGTMEAEAQLTVAPELTFSGSVSGATNAGGMVGNTADGAKITVQNNYKVSGSISSENGNAGGLIGSALNNPVTVTEGKNISVSSASLLAGANSAAGGLFGNCTVSENTAELDLASYTINNISITSGKYAGGAFGILSNITDNSTIKIQNRNQSEISSAGQGADNYGGLIGSYQADHLTFGLELTGLSIASSHTRDEKTAYSGVIAEVTGKSYVKMENLTVSVDQKVANGNYFGALVANCSGDGTSGFFDIGTVKISSITNNTVKAEGASGGLIGKLQDGVVRLFGKTDLSGIQPGGEGSQYGRLVGNRGAALVYAVGTGSDFNADTAAGWTLVRDVSGKCVSDIGNWGEVIRMDGTKLKEGSSELLAYASAAHTVTVKSFELSGILNEQDFAALALTMQCSGANTEGALRFSGSADLNSQITLTGANNIAIDLTGTGVTGLMRDDGTQGAFTGSLNGKSRTVILDIGDVYGVKADGTKCTSADAGCGQIYNHSYLGLFAKTGGTNSISNLTVSGSINYGLSTQKEIWVGGVTAFQETGAASYQNVTSDIAISFTGSVAADPKETLKAAHVGGFVGAASGAPQLTFTGCKWTGSITDSAATASDCYLGGYIGSMSHDGGSITLKNSSIGNGTDNNAAITVTQSDNVSKTGGILAAVETKEGTDNKITITADGFTVNGFDTSSAATESTGGFLGYDWHNVDFTVSGLSVSNATLTAENAGFGGLVYEAGGHWIVKEPDESQDAGQNTAKYGIKYGTGVSFNGKSVDDTPSALLVCRGDDYRSTEDREDNCALYLQMNSKAAYQVDPSVSVTLNSGTYFDELVGISMGTYGNGVVSIATENHEKLNQSNYNTYQKQLSKDYDNSHTRYYYNLDQFPKAEGDITSGEELIMWTLGQNAEWNIKDYFRTEDKDTYTKVRTVTGTIDLTGLSYYPIDYVGKINITGATITFDYAQINSCEKTNKELNNSEKQHYMMQTGLFQNLTSQDTYAAGITVKNGSKLSGSIGQTAEGNSGLLVVGTMEGKVTQNILYPATIQIDGLTLNGIYVDGVENDDYAPLLVNAASRNTTLNIKNVTTSDQYKKDNRTQAATSLFGNIGSETAINMNVSFQNMKLDARTDSGKPEVLLYNTTQSIFTKATFLNSFQYAPTDKASSGSYTFTKDDTVKQSGNAWTGNVTYGLEISNTESGRNPGQQYYYLGDINRPEYVVDGILKTTSQDSTDKTCFANGKYLRYVAIAENSAGKAYYHELDINLQSADILEGCGTYDDPFQITSGAQLETVAAFIASGNSTGWKVNLPKNVINNKASLSAHDSTSVDGHYEYTSGELWKATEDTTGLKKADVRAYMRNAYYQIQNDIDLSNSFYGLGGSNPDTNTFSGVIVGKKAEDGSCPKIYISAQGTTKTYGGLIAFSQGSVVKDLVLEFSGRTANGSENGAAGQTTGVSESCSPMEITIEAQAASQERDKQSFFGGVIGYIVGGDNIIDNVELNGLTTDKINVNKGNGNVNLVDIGGYVGLIGGNLESGGGVIFRNIKGSGLSEYGNDTAKDFYYRNPFVGRVLDGYACSEGIKLENTDKNYSIPQLTDGDKLTVTSSDISIASGQQLWVLSAIVNSGAGGGSGNEGTITYNNDAYLYGRSRTGNYADVGKSVLDSGDKTDNKYWGGVNNKLTTGQVSYLVSQYASSKNAAKLSATPGKTVPAYKVIFNDDCDMREYGNGFRGIGTTYQDNNTKTNNIPDILKRCIKTKGTVGDNGTQNRTITLARNVKEYASEGNGGWWAQGIGLFPVINISDTTTVKYLTISGIACISYQDDRTEKSHVYIGEASAGGFAGMTANGSNSNNQIVTFQNVKAENLTVTGSKYSGGFYGVIGKSSRTSATGLTEVSSVVGPYTFSNCTYDKIKVEGGYSAGGFVGTYRNDGKAMTVSGTTALSGSDIGWVNDACLEMYTVNKSQPNETTAKDNAKMKGYSGGGGIVGYYYGGDMTVNNVTVQSLRIYGPRFAFNCNYGLGGVVGSYTNTSSLKVENVNIEDTVVEVDLSMSYSSPYKSLQDYYLTPTCGLVAGYSSSKTTANTITVNRCAVLNAGCGGGIIGNNQNQNSTLTDTTISNLDIYSQGAASYSGSPRIGGVIGSSVYNITLENLTMTNVNVISDGVTGLVLGQAYNNSQLKVKNFINKDCNVAVTQLKGNYLLGNANDPNSIKNPSKKNDSVAGATGMLLGANKEGSGILMSDEIILGYNISAENLTLGVYCDEKAKLSYTYEYNNESTSNKTYSGKFTSNGKEISDFKAVIGLNDEKPEQNIPYSSVSMTDSKQYRGGYLGLIVGAKKDPTNLTMLRPIQIVGLSLKGGNYPYELNGNNDATFVTKKIQNNIIQCNGNTNKDNYVIFADYLNSSFQTDTIPSVVTNPVSNLTVYPSAEAGKGNILTSDGVSDSAKSSIVSDLTDSTTQTPYQKQYNRVKYNKNNTLANVAEKFDSQNGDYKSRISTYFTASESKAEEYTGVDDFEVLVIDTSKSSEITQMIHEYISVLTNCDQTGISAATADKAQYTNMKTYTYKWNGNKFIKTDSSLIVDNDGSVSVRAGAHDNQNDQFTVLDVYYANPSNTKEGYHLFIPIVVKKILQTEFSIKMLNGSSAYDSAYTTNAAILANYKGDFTAQLTYSYIWTADEWNANIAAGTNFLWSYDKQVKLGDAKGSLGNASTRYTLIDMNRREAGSTFFTGNGTALESTENKQDAVLKFNNLEDSSKNKYASVYLSDLLPLKVDDKASNGTLKKVSSREKATIRIWNGKAYDYYGPKSSDDPADTTYYTLVIDGKTGTDEVKVSEVYYLTVNCQEGAGVITQNATLGLDKMTSLNPSALPSRKRGGETQNTYTLGDFYKVSDVSITPEGKDKTTIVKSGTNDAIDLLLKAKVEVPDEYKSQFETYAKNDPVYFQFAVRMHNTSQDDTGTDQILTQDIRVSSVKLGENTLVEQDYTYEVSNGVLYVTVKNKKGVDFSNVNIEAQLRLNYAGEMDAQFPMRKGNDSTSGITFSMNAAIAYSENSLDGSLMNGSNENSQKFYRETINSVRINYYAYDTVSNDGNVSQLGINGKEVADQGGVTITTQGIYNATDIAGLNTTEKEDESYPYYLIGSLELQKKDNSGKYTDVTMSDYIKSVSINKGNTQNPGQKYEFEIPLTPAQVQNLATEPLKIDFSYFVKSDKALEDLGAQAQYANYKVILTAHLANKSGTALIEDVSDYLIYTNAKFYDGIISTRDFDEK